jgi:hypothetical protein
MMLRKNIDVVQHNLLHMLHHFIPVGKPQNGIKNAVPMARGGMG